MKIAALLFCAFLAFPSTVDALSVPDEYQSLVHIFWKPADVPMLAKIIECESQWDRFAVGDSGELGLMQISPTTWEDARQRLGSAAPPAIYGVWTSPAMQFYQAQVIKSERGWEPWSCNDTT